MTLPPQHVHVSERERAHRWPDGRWDDAIWEDCRWDVGVEFARLVGGKLNGKTIPPTHVEAEALRAASGEPPTGGSNYDNVRLAYSRRYRLLTNPPVRGFPALWRALTPGSVASVSGLMAAFPSWHRLRRHDDFAGTHQVLVMRLDGTDRVWWCDPLAPTGYRGEWVSKSDLERFVSRLGNWPQMVGRIVYPGVPAQVIARLREYIARLAAARQTPAVVKKLAEYRRRLAEYLRRG